MIIPELVFKTDPIKGSEASFLAGRRGQIRDAIKTLSRSNMSCVVFGERGVGKTTLAWQIATILDKTNDKFSLDEFSKRASLKTYMTCFYKCHAAINSVDHLILDVIRPREDDYSVSSVFSEVYERDDYNSKIKDRYGFGFDELARVVLLEDMPPEGLKAQNNNFLPYVITPTIARNLFQDVFKIISDHYEDSSPIVFIDEFDQLGAALGFGSFLKITNDVKFCLVGISRSVDALVADHLSAGRKLTNAAVEVPTLDRDEIKWIFKRANLNLHGLVEFSDGFIDLACEYSQGFPWIAQNLGLLILEDIEDPDGEVITVDESYFDQYLKKVLDIYLREKNISVKIDTILDSQSQKLILKTLLNLGGNVKQDELRSAVNDGKKMGTAQKRLIEAKVIVKNENGNISFEDSIIQILLKYHVEKLKD